MRFAHGTLLDGRITFEVIKQSPNDPKGRCWNLDHLVSFCREALQYAQSVQGSLGIDSWGVDHGFIDAEGRVVQEPILYRDPSHLAMSEAMIAHRKHLFGLTGIAHQPFNTLYQLAARGQENPELAVGAEWYLMPDLIGFLLTGVRHHEQTQSSTTQLMGLDGTWSEEAFQLIGWPTPTRQPQPPGGILSSVNGVPVVNVCSHDTGSAVAGVGSLPAGSAYLNVGTWALLGTVLKTPVTTDVALAGNWTNEWGQSGTIRFLKNIPGFYVINRLHSELAPTTPIGEWLTARDKSFEGRLDPHHPELYNPDSMASAVERVSTRRPTTGTEFAQVALASLTETVCRDLESLEDSVGQIKSLRVVGGGSRSTEFCQALADVSHRTVEAGPVEATVLGNLAMQFLATGALTAEDMPSVIDASAQRIRYVPGGAS